MIPFNKPAITGNEFAYMQEALDRGRLSGNGYFSQRCAAFFKERYGFEKVLLTNSGTDALEMAAILCGLEKDDEIIIPSFTFPSCANAFILRGAKIIFADCEEDSPNISAAQIREKISAKTKAILVVHYAGVACAMETIVAIAKKNDLFLIEDCAHAIDSYSYNKPLGSYGDFAAFSFHETKNIQCGEGGMLVVNNKKYAERAEIIWEKGTNRVAFAEGKISKYNWVDIGSSFLLSELQAAFLYAQLEKLDIVQADRKAIWNRYFLALQNHRDTVHCVPAGIDPANNNASIFYLLCRDGAERDALLLHLEQEAVMAVFHYLPLHLSPYYKKSYPGMHLPQAEKVAASIIRLPLYFGLKTETVSKINTCIITFFESKAQIGHIFRK